MATWRSRPRGRLMPRDLQPTNLQPTLREVKEICSERTLHERLRRGAVRTLSDPRHGLEAGGWLVATWHRRPPRDARADLRRGWRLEVGWRPPETPRRPEARLEAGGWLEATRDPAPT